MNNDIKFVEQIVKRKTTQTDIMFFVSMFIAATVIAAAMFAFQLMPYGFIIICLAYYGAWWLGTRRNREYEYAVTEGELDIDIIFAKRSRKRMVTVDAKAMEVFAPADDVNRAQYENTGIKKRLWACSDVKSENIYFCIFHMNNIGRAVLFFEPNEEVYKALRLYNPSVIN